MIFHHVRVTEIELSRPLPDFDGLDGVAALRALILWHGEPLGEVRLPVLDGHCSASAIAAQIMQELSHAWMGRLLEEALSDPARFQQPFAAPLPPVPPAPEKPLISVLICTRDRTADLSECLQAVACLEYPHLEVIVVDNAPRSEATAQMVQAEFPGVRYLREERPGLDWARSRAAREARGEILAYTDDDVLVDAGWAAAIAESFSDPDVMAVTGLVLPAELEQESQAVFELYGGFSRGFRRRWVRLHPDPARRWGQYGAGQYGTGANMAYRRSLLEKIGTFDPALDVGTVTNGGGDLEMFFRTLVTGHTLLYNPAVRIRHHHRRQMTQLYTQIENNGYGLSSYLVACARRFPSERWALAYLYLWWLAYWHVRRWLVSKFRPVRFPPAIIAAELKGFLKGLPRYGQAQAAAKAIEAKFGPSGDWVPERSTVWQPTSTAPAGAVLTVSLELSEGLAGLPQASEYASVQVTALWQGRVLGQVRLDNFFHPVSAAALRQALAEGLTQELLGLFPGFRTESSWLQAWPTLRSLLEPSISSERMPVPSLAPSLPVTILVPTGDRPEDLRACLESLTRQNTGRPFEILVVDNRPASGLTPPVVAAFPGVRLIREARPGSSYARNAGFLNAQHEIILMTDDDVIAPPDWVERLAAPFAEPGVMAVSGNILPLELETPAQRLFETYGGLGRGFKRREYDGAWFESFRLKAVPTWELGGTANLGIRRSALFDPAIGLLEETLGAGMPAGVGEDTYLFYRILKSDGKMVYQPDACVYHRHRRELSALRRQVLNYSKGHVAYHLTTLLQDGDGRALFYLLVMLPKVRLWQIKEKLLRRRPYPTWMLWTELWGNLLGPLSLLQSRIRVARLGRSAPPIPMEAAPKEVQNL